MRSVRLCVLSSGSGGNSLWVDAGATRILIDAGLPLRETARRCKGAGLDVRDLRDLDALILEMNHDVQMLLEGPYPWSLKQRIRGGRGHLSNEQGACLLESILHGGLRHLVLAHLSEHNNSEKHARKAAEGVLANYGSHARLCLGSQARAL